LVKSKSRPLFTPFGNDFSVFCLSRKQGNPGAKTKREGELRKMLRCYQKQQANAKGQKNHGATKGPKCHPLNLNRLQILIAHNTAFKAITTPGLMFIDGGQKK